MRRLLDLFRRRPDPRQLPLALEPPAPRRAPPRVEPGDEARAALTARLDDLLGGRLARLILTDNRTSLLSSRRDAAGRVTLRLHWSFLTADAETLSAAALLASVRLAPAARARAGALVRAHVVTTARPAEAPAPRRGPRSGLRSQGEVHDLAALRDEINRDYFGGRLEVAIGWSRGGAPGMHRQRRGRGASLHLGTWNEIDRRVRIHPVLDHPSVPREVVAAVVHHELLHAELGAVVQNGRRRVHTPEFRRREREFAHFELAERWVARHFRDLVARRRKL